jgi:hypothetical protein
MQYEPGSVCFLAPGNVVWKSDIDALRSLRKGEEAQSTLETVVAKYLINRDQGSGDGGQEQQITKIE